MVPVGLVCLVVSEDNVRLPTILGNVQAVGLPGVHSGLGQAVVHLVVQGVVLLGAAWGKGSVK